MPAVTAFVNKGLAARLPRYLASKGLMTLGVVVVGALISVPAAVPAADPVVERDLDYEARESYDLD